MAGGIVTEKVDQAWRMVVMVFWLVLGRGYGGITGFGGDIMLFVPARDKLLLLCCLVIG